VRRVWWWLLRTYRWWRNPMRLRVGDVISINDERFTVVVVRRSEVECVRGGAS
jgi:hypothetical protein